MKRKTLLFIFLFCAFFITLGSKNVNAKSFQLRVWFSNTGMGSGISEMTVGERYYLCYEIIDLSTGKRANADNNMSYQVKEVIKKSDGSNFQYTYSNSDNNWISFVPTKEGNCVGTVTVSGDLSVEASVNLKAYNKVRPGLKVSAYDSDSNSKITEFEAGKETYINYTLADIDTKEYINDTSIRYTEGNGYSVTVNIYKDDILVKSAMYRNKDHLDIYFTPLIGQYKVVVKVDGTISVSKEITYSSTEKEHIYGGWTVTTQATCTGEGRMEATCTLCGRHTLKTIPPKGHNYSDKVVAATCSSEGYTLHTCSACGYSYKSDYTDKSSHLFGNWIVIKNATCTEEGIEYRQCILCWKEETRKIEKTNHNYVDNVILPTKYSKGYTQHICSVCESSYIDSYTYLNDNNNNNSNNSGNKNNNNANKNNNNVEIKNTGNSTLSETIKGIGLSSRSRKLIIKWKKQTGAIQYQLLVATNKKMKKARLYYTTKNSKTIKKLKKGKKYYVKIRVVKVLNNKKVYGSWSIARNRKIA